MKSTLEEQKKKFRKIEEITKDDQVVTKVYETKDYEKFYNIVENREINQTNLNKLIKSMSENYYISPILTTFVGGQLKVIDGQHRLEAVRILNLPLYYIIIELNKPESIVAIMQLNKASREWKVLDFIKYFSACGNENYIQLLKLRNEFPKIKSLDVYISIGQDSFRRPRTNGTEGIGGYIVNGKYIFADYDKAVKVCHMLGDYEKFGIYKNATFKECLLRLFKLDSYNHKQFLKMMKKYDGGINTFATIDEYLMQMTEFYNIGKQDKNKINFYLEHKKRIQEFKRAKKNDTIEEEA